MKFKKTIAGLAATSIAVTAFSGCTLTNADVSKLVSAYDTTCTVLSSNYDLGQFMDLSKKLQKSGNLKSISSSSEDNISWDADAKHVQYYDDSGMVLNVDSEAITAVYEDDSYSLIWDNILDSDTLYNSTLYNSLDDSTKESLNEYLEIFDELDTILNDGSFIKLVSDKTGKHKIDGTYYKVNELVYSIYDDEGDSAVEATFYIDSNLNFIRQAWLTLKDEDEKTVIGVTVPYSIDDNWTIAAYNYYPDYTLYSISTVETSYENNILTFNTKNKSNSLKTVNYDEYDNISYDLQTSVSQSIFKLSDSRYYCINATKEDGVTSKSIIFGSYKINSSGLVFNVKNGTSSDVVETCYITTKPKFKDVEVKDILDRTLEELMN